MIEFSINPKGLIKGVFLCVRDAQSADSLPNNLNAKGKSTMSDVSPSNSQTAPLPDHGKDIGWEEFSGLKMYQLVLVKSSGMWAHWKQGLPSEEIKMKWLTSHSR